MIAWLSAEWHKGLIVLLALDHLWDRGVRVWERFKPLEDYVERRFHERRKQQMDLPVLHQLAILIEEIFKSGAKAATPAAEAAGAAAATAAVQTAETDPRVAAGLALLVAAQNLKGAMSAPVVTPGPVPVPAPTEPPNANPQQA